MSSPPPKSLVPAPASAPTVWPPSNPSGTVIPFPLPWGGAGCCPPGGMDALMKCYCDIQQASAFIGQVMLDQINNNPAIIQAIIAGIEKSGSNLPLLGVTNGVAAQPGQVGEFVQLEQVVPYTAAAQVTTVSMGVLQPGDWDCWIFAFFSAPISNGAVTLNPQPAGFANNLNTFMALPTADFMTITSTATQGLTSVPTLIAIALTTNSAGGGTAGDCYLFFTARRRR